MIATLGFRSPLARLGRHLLARMRTSRPRARRRRILFCTLNYAPGATGGAERQARLQAEELVRRGYEVTVVCPREPRQRSGAINGVRVRRLPVRWHGRGRRPLHLLGLGTYLLFAVHRF
ncbi:MAG: glycosyltransferase, partial [Dehalococcoidia bacterium]